MHERLNCIVEEFGPPREKLAALSSEHITIMSDGHEICIQQDSLDVCYIKSSDRCRFGRVISQCEATCLGLKHRIENYGAVKRTSDECVEKL